MTRGTIRVLLRRQLMEVIPQGWPDDILNELINHSLHLAQKEVMKVSPEEFLEWTRRALIANESFYFKPEGEWWPNQVRVLRESGGRYQRLTFKPFDVAEEWGSSHDSPITGTADPGGMVWSRRGRYVCIFPPPSANVVDGLELIHVPTLTVTVDADIPAVPISLHIAIVYMAKMLALGETYQNYDADAAQVQRIIGDLPMYFATTGGENLSWRPDIVKPRGYAGS